MRGKTLLGALLVSVALSSQAFGFELLDRMLGLNTGCGTCDPCGEVACCEPAAKCCAPEPACCERPACCEPECGKATCRPCCDLFGGLKGLFACRSCGKASCCEPECCEKAKCCAPEPACCEPACCKPRCQPLLCKPRCCEPKCCEPACCEKPACCEPECGKAACKQRCICVPNFGLLDSLGGLFKCHRCCKTSCCEEGCCDTCGGGAAEATAPATAPQEEAAPLPKAPVADPSASNQRYYRRIVRN
jgi:hypothetical protein